MQANTSQLGHGRKILDTTDEILVSWDLKHSGASQSRTIGKCQLGLEVGYLILVTVHGENMPILGFMGDLSDYLVKNRKKNLTQ